MHVLAIHEIVDPEGFQAAEERFVHELVESGWPQGVSDNPITLYSPDHRHEYCLFTADSVEVVRDFLDRTLGEPWSRNTYVEIHPASVPAVAA